MDTRHMHYFMALAETLHFGRAAKLLHMTQPPFSRQIALIEQKLGVKLFERNSRHVTLTPAGKHFLDDCRTVIAQFDAACRDVRLVASGMKGELRFGFMMHAAHSVVPRLVQCYSEIRPDVRLVLEERTPTEIDDMLMAGKLDAAVTFAPGYSQHLRTIHLAKEKLRMIMRADHACANKRMIGPDDLCHERLIATPTSVAPTLRSAIASYFAAGGISPNFVLEPRLQHTIIKLVAEGLGVALIPESLCSMLDENLVSKPLRTAPTLDVVLCAPIASANPAVSALMDIAAQSSC